MFFFFILYFTSGSRLAGSELNKIKTTQNTENKMDQIFNLETLG